jgi:hypothetical protein
MVILLIFYRITQDVLLACMGIPSITAVVVLILYVEFLGRKNFILTSNMIQLSSKPRALFMAGPLDRSQLKIDDITGCRVYNNIILVWIGSIGYPIRKNQLDDFNRVRDTLIKLLKSRNVPVKIYHRDLIEPPTV